jgi:hypothetical protein
MLRAAAYVEAAALRRVHEGRPVTLRPDFYPALRSLQLLAMSL